MVQRNQQPGWANTVSRAICIGLGILFIWLALNDSPSIGGGIGFGLIEMGVLAAGVVTVVAGLLPQRFAVPFSLILVTTLVTLALAEIVLSRVLGPRYQTAYAFDPRYLFKLEPGVSRHYTHLPANGGNTVVYRINSDGFRGEELKEGNHPRVMVYGDSFIHAEFSELQDTFPVRLNERLGDGIEVVNAGVAGYGPDQILRRMEDELPRIKADLVVVSLFSGNDFGDLLRNRLYRLSEDGALAENAWRLTPDQERQIALNENELVLRKIVGEALGALRGGGADETFAFDPQQWIKDGLAQHQREYDEFVVQGDNTVGAFGVDPYSADVAFFPDSASAIYKIRMLDAIVARMREVADVNGVPLAIMVVPHPMDLLDGNHSSGFVDITEYSGYDPARLTDTMTAIAQRNAVSVLNLFQTFKSEDVDSLFLKGGDDHWNAEGQALAAEAMADFLTSQGLLSVQP